MSTGSTRLTGGVVFNNVDTGIVDVRTGTLSIEGTFPNFSSTTSTLTGGTYVVAGTLQFTNAKITTNAASIVLDGPSSRIVNPSSIDALAGFRTNAAGGSFTIQNGRNFTAATPFSNVGSVTIGADSTFTASSFYTQTGGSTSLSGGTLAVTMFEESFNSENGGAGVLNLALTDERVRFQKASFDHPQLFMAHGHPGDQIAVKDSGGDGIADQEEHQTMQHTRRARVMQ